MKLVVWLSVAGVLFAVAAFLLTQFSAKTTTKGAHFYVVGVLARVLWLASWMGAMCLALMKDIL
jgi:hypothetical protein